MRLRLLCPLVTDTTERRLETAGRFDGGATWIAYPSESMQRASHVLLSEGECWLVDPVDAPTLDEWLAEYGEVAGVVVLLDRHRRDAAALANRHDVPVFLPPTLGPIADEFDAPVERFEGSLAETGFEPTPVVERSRWRETALYRAADETLVVPEALGTASFFRAGSERVGVHPVLRPRPPRRALGGFDPERLLVGHGAPLLEDAGTAVADALAGARRRMPRAYAGMLRTMLPI